MSEIKFACPCCSQHIACDATYADLAIECPLCGESMVVPRLTGTAAAHSGMVIVASTSGPAPRVVPPPVIAKAWTEAEWARNAGPGDVFTGGAASTWMAAALGTLIIAAILRVYSAGAELIVAWVILGSIVSGVLLAKSRGTSGSRAILTALALVVATIIVLPVLALSVLFLGCAACAGR